MAFIMVFGGATAAALASLDFGLPRWLESPFSFSANATEDEWKGEGSGIETDPYIIETAEHLAFLASSVNNKGETYENKFFKLVNDIALNSPDVFTYDGDDEENGNVTGKAAGKTPNEWTAIGSNYDNTFKGTFDGGGHTVSGIYINKTENFQGLFGYVSDGTIKNLGIISSYIKGGSRVGGVAGVNRGTIANCHSKKGTVTGSDRIGGMAGENWGIVSNCRNSGIVKGSENVGGIVGENRGIVSNCYNTDSVTGPGRTGGVVGLNNSEGTVSNCYNIGSVTGTGSYSYVGGVAGINSDGAVADCYYLSGKATGGIDSADIGGQAESLTDAQMKNQNSFANWDFTDVWTINGDPDYEYPELYVLQKVDVTSVEILPEDEEVVLFLFSKTTHRFKAKISPSNATNKAIEWGSSDEDIASVDEKSGLVTAVSPGTAVITVTAIDGGFTDIYEVTVKRNDAGGFAVTDIPNRIYTGGEIKPAVEVKFGDVTLTLNTDYTVGYTDNINAGTATVTITGIDRFENDKIANFTITEASASSFSVTGIQNPKYTGAEHTPTVGVKFNGETLTLGIDYTVGYEDNINIGTARVIITGIGNFEGTKTVTFNILPIEPEKITISDKTLELICEDTATLSAVIEPYNTTNQNIIWLSSDKKVATVDADGKVTATGRGTATITAIVEFSDFSDIRSDTCTVTVKLTFRQWIIKTLMFWWHLIRMFFEMFKIL